MSIFFGGTHFYYANRVWFWWFQSIIGHVGVTVLVIQWIAHTSFCLQDLCSKSRKSVNWRKVKPQITKAYILMILTSEIGVFLYMWTIILLVGEQWKYFVEYCHIFIIISSDTWILAKEFMYFSFLLRLNVIYGKSQYRYPVRVLIIIAIVSMCLTIMNMLFTVFFNNSETIFYDNYPLFLHCSAYYPLFHVLAVGTLDTIMALGFLYAFIRPLRLLAIQHMTSVTNVNATSQNVKSLGKLMSLGKKSLILTTVAVSSTLFFLILILFTDSLFFGPIDCVLNNFCIMFMTPYYKDELYYERYCCGPIKLSHKISFIGNTKQQKTAKLHQLVSVTTNGKDNSNVDETENTHTAYN